MNLIKVNSVKVTCKGTHITFGTKVSSWLTAPPPGIVIPKKTLKRVYNASRIYAPYWYSADQILNYIQPANTQFDMEDVAYMQTKALVRSLETHKYQDSWMTGAPYPSTDKGHTLPYTSIRILVCHHAPSIPGYIGIAGDCYERTITKNVATGNMALAVLKAVLFVIRTAGAPGGKLMLAVHGVLPYKMLTEPATPRTKAENRVIRSIYKEIGEQDSLSVVFTQTPIKENREFINCIMQMGRNKAGVAPYDQKQLEAMRRYGRD